ncbi:MULTISPECIES: hypothetical protein [Sphingobacterium]|uniref:Immunity protein 43 domain-containing protein n=1 Tax=Sphingobacterium populi TaxID=1812824 RepID=A0ABW5U811_9SPHI|nr:hypothetical protein [Sphingobacterium sp. CFCC 11742]
MMNYEITLPPIFMKVSSKERLESFRNGDIFFSDFKTFRDDKNPNYIDKLAASVYGLEAKRPNYDYYRNDPLEGVKSIHFGENYEVKVTYRDDFAKVLCLFGFSHNWAPNSKISEEMSEFGTHFLIFNSRSFLTNLFPEVQKYSLGPSPVFDYVEFYDIVPNKNIDNLSQLHKKRYYEYQCEYRILANLNVDTINIGPSLTTENSSILLPIQELKNAEYIFEELPKDNV